LDICWINLQIWLWSVFFQLSNEVSDDILQRVFAEEGTIELNEAKLATLAPGKTLHSTIIDFCVKW
jgi:hypothetical protein